MTFLHILCEENLNNIHKIISENFLDLSKKPSLRGLSLTVHFNSGQCLTSSKHSTPKKSIISFSHPSEGISSSSIS